MPFTVYLLRSETSGRLYVGQTHDLARRLREHAGGKVVSTRGRGPWTLVAQRAFETRGAAVRFERRVKAMKRPDRVAEAFGLR